MKLARFIHYGGSTMPRLFLHHAEWALNEVRAVTEQEAEELKRHFPGSFTITDPEPPKTPDPPEPVKFTPFLKPAETPDNPPAKPAKE